MTGKLDHDFGPSVGLHSIGQWASLSAAGADYGATDMFERQQLSVPVGGYVAALPTSAINAAQVCPYTPATNPAAIAVTRNQIQVKSVEGDLWGQTEVTARFKVFGLKNNLAAGVEGGQEISDPIRSSYTINKVNTVPSTVLLSPNAADAFAGTGYITPSLVRPTSKSVGLYFVDTMHLGRFL